MEAKEYLGQIELLHVKIKQKRQELDKVNALLLAPGSIDYSKERVQVSPEDRMGKAIAHGMDLKDELAADIERFLDARDKVISQIHGLGDVRYINLLYKRYIEYKKLGQIADEMVYSYDYARELHGCALQVFSKKYLD